MEKRTEALIEKNSGSQEVQTHPCSEKNKGVEQDKTQVEHLTPSRAVDNSTGCRRFFYLNLFTSQHLNFVAE